MNDTEIVVREIEPADHDWVRSFLGQHFGSTKVVSRGVLHQADDLPGFIAMFCGAPRALLTYCVMNGELTLGGRPIEDEIEFELLLEKAGVCRPG